MLKLMLLEASTAAELLEACNRLGFTPVGELRAEAIAVKPEPPKPAEPVAKQPTPPVAKPEPPKPAEPVAETTPVEQPQRKASGKRRKGGKGKSNVEFVNYEIGHLKKIGLLVRGDKTIAIGVLQTGKHEEKGPWFKFCRITNRKEHGLSFWNFADAKGAQLFCSPDDVTDLCEPTLEAAEMYAEMGS